MNTPKGGIYVKSSLNIDIVNIDFHAIFVISQNKIIRMDADKELSIDHSDKIGAILFEVDKYIMLQT